MAFSRHEEQHPRRRSSVAGSGRAASGHRRAAVGCSAPAGLQAKARQGPGQKRELRSRATRTRDMNDKNQTTKLPELDNAELASVTGGQSKMRVGRVSRS